MTLGLAGVSAAGRPIAVGTGAMQAPRADRIGYRFDGLSEWFVNGPSGLEQGFTVAHPLGADRLTFDVAVGGARAAAAAGGAVVFRAGGHDVFGYGQLVVSDARGRLLPAQMKPAGRGVRIAVDARGAVYPLRVDPTVTQTATLTVSHPGVPFVGFSDAVSDSTIVVNATGRTTGGAAYVFSKPAGGWVDATQTAKLTGSDVSPGDRFGESVGVSGSTIVVSAPGPTFGTANPGALYVYTEPADGWHNATQTAKLTLSASAGAPPDLGARDGFGDNVAISGSTIVSGALKLSGTDDAQDVADVFSEPAGGWVNATQTAEFAVSTPTPGSVLIGSAGPDVSASGSTIAVGVTVSTTDSQVDLFSQPAGGWVSASPTAVLTKSCGAQIVGGPALSGSGSQIAVEAWLTPLDPNKPDELAVCQYQRPAGGWSDVAPMTKLSPTNATLHNGGVVQFATSGATTAGTVEIHNAADSAVIGGVIDVWAPSTRHAGSPSRPTVTLPSVFAAAPTKRAVNVPVVVRKQVYATVPASCPKGGAACSARVSVRVATVTRRVVSRASTVANKKRTAKPRTVTIASAKVKLAAGKKRTLKLKLSRAGLSLLKHAKGHQLRATVLVEAAGKTKTRNVILKLATVQKHHRSSRAVSH